MNKNLLSRTRLGLSAVALAVLAACGSVPARPTLELPQATPAAAGAPSAAQLERWWTLFNDEQLTTLVDEALANNLDLRTATARIDEARANLRLARSALLPSLDAAFNSRRSRNSEAQTFRQGPPFLNTQHTAELQASYEIDAWGRVRAGRNAAASSLQAATYDAQAVRIALAAQVAATYFQLRAFDAELELTRATLGTRDENVRLQRRRAEVGESSRFDLAQAEAERASVAAAIPALERAVAQTQAALAVLAGRSPRDVFAPNIARGAVLERFAPAPEVPPGLPSDLLARRPDVQRAEAQLAASESRITEARAQYFPRLSLTAAFGSSSAELSDLFSGPATVWSLAGGLVQPIIGVARIGAEVDAANARNQQASLGYVQTVQTAFREVHDALVAHRTARDSFVAQEERRARIAETLRLADIRYKNGYTSQLELLDAQRGLLAADRDRINALLERQTALIDLYKALGGGWAPELIAAK